MTTAAMPVFNRSMDIVSMNLVQSCIHTSYATRCMHLCNAYASYASCSFYAWRDCAAHFNRVYFIGGRQFV